MDNVMHPGPAREEAATQYDSAEIFRWNAFGSGVTIIELSSPGERPANVRIPPFIQGKPVTRIGFNAFRGIGLASVSLPESVTFIGTGAFSNNRLGAISLPPGLTVIEDAAFENNSLAGVVLPPKLDAVCNRVFANNVLASVTIPEGVTSIGSEAFLNNLLSAVSIPASVRRIGDRAFEQNQLASVVIPRGVTVIENSVFAFNRLSSVTIPDTVVHIGIGAFEDNRLAEVDIPFSVTNIEDRAFAWNRLAGTDIPASVVSAGENVFIQYDSEEGFIWKMSGSGVVITGQIGNRIRVRIPPEIQGMPVTEVAEGAFTGSHVHRRTSVTIPDSVTGIGKDAFAYNHLSCLSVPGSVACIGPGAFANNRLSELTLEHGIKTIAGSHPQYGSGAFANNRLTGVRIPDSVTYIGDWAFSGNPLSSLSLPGSVAYIGAAFPCHAIVSDVFVFEQGFLARLINDGTAVKIIRCTAIEEEVRIPSHIRDLPVTVIGDGALEYSFARWAVGIRMTGVTIPATAVFIERSAFMGQGLCSVTIPDSVAYIGAMAFAGNRLSSISIGADVTFLRWPPIYDTTGGFGPAFAAFYESHGRKAGMYTFCDGVWSAVFR